MLPFSVQGDEGGVDMSFFCCHFSAHGGEDGVDMSVFLLQLSVQGGEDELDMSFLCYHFRFRVMRMRWTCRFFASTFGPG